jgi:hypothetical protein
LLVYLVQRMTAMAIADSDKRAAGQRRRLLKERDSGVADDA